MVSDTAPTLIWHSGTAYDMFVSLHAVFNPSKFEIRRAWAAGVRSRLPKESLDTIRSVSEVSLGPMAWVDAQPAPRNAAQIVNEMRALAPRERLRALTVAPMAHPDVLEHLYDVAERGDHNADDEETLKSLVVDTVKGKRMHKDSARKLLALWANADEVGEEYLSTLATYHEAFFEEEEKRIQPALEKGLTHAQKLAEKLPLTGLLEELSQGLRFDALFEAKELVIAPSYWCTPLVIMERVSEDRLLLLFGARPANASLVPGEVVPDALYNALKALADPTRLRIMRYLSSEPLTPAQLARRLRLRAPTVTHHLHALRVAGLVHLTLQAGNERRYAARRGMIDATCAMLDTFLHEQDTTDDVSEE